MKVGLIARSESRGLGNMTSEWARHMAPDKTLVIVPAGVTRAGLESHLDWYPDATVMRYGGSLPKRECLEWLDGLDVVYSAETFYDWQFCVWARQKQVATVCHLMPEWWRPRWEPFPTAWWAPTSWRLDQLPAGTSHVPVPVPADRFGEPDAHAPHELRWLHVAGAQTEADRNGTQQLVDALAHVREQHHVVIRAQTPLPIDTTNVNVEHRTGVEHYWELYHDADAFVLPRRYAGLCLPVLEAFGAGLPTVMTDLDPQRDDWPVATVKTDPGEHVATLCGNIPTGDADPHHLAKLMDHWATHPEIVQGWREQVAHYVAANRWEVRAPQIRAQLEEVADLVAA